MYHYIVYYSFQEYIFYEFFFIKISVQLHNLVLLYREIKIPKCVNIKVIWQYLKKRKRFTSLTHFVNIYSYYVFVSVILIQMTYPKIMNQSGTPAHMSNPHRTERSAEVELFAGADGLVEFSLLDHVLVASTCLSSGTAHWLSPSHSCFCLSGLRTWAGGLECQRAPWINTVSSGSNALRPAAKNDGRAYLPSQQKTC